MCNLQCGGGPFVLGGRLVVDEHDNLEQGAAFSRKFCRADSHIGPTTIFHDTDLYCTKLQYLSRLGWHEIDRDLRVQVFSQCCRVRPSLLYSRHTTARTGYRCHSPVVFPWRGFLYRWMQSRLWLVSFRNMQYIIDNGGGCQLGKHYF